MTEARALLFADWRSFVNDAKRVVRSPRRMFFWICSTLALALFIVNRALTPVHRTQWLGNDTTRADLLICGMLLTVALTLAFGAGQLGFFRTRAEALLITGSSVPAPIAITYLQTRESLATSLRLLWSVVVFGYVAAPSHLSPLAALSDFALFAALVAARNAIALPRLFAPPAMRVSCTIVGTVLAILIVEPPLRDIARSLHLPAGAAHFVRYVLPAWHPGLVMFSPSPWWLACALAVMATGIGVVARSGRDAYPDLYALSLARIDGVAFRAERLGRILEKRRGLPAIPVRIPAPPGPLVFFWKSLVEFRRQHRDARFLIGGAFVWAILGAGIALQTRHAVAATITTLAVAGGLVAFVLSRPATKAVIGDLRQPLFWLSGSPLFERLCALVASRNWRKSFSFALIASGVAVAGGSEVEVLVLAVLLPAVAVHFASTGLAIYAFAPEDAGLNSTLGIIVTALLLAPVVAIGILGAPAGATFDIALIAAVLLAETTGLLAFVAWRIDGRSDRMMG